MNGETNKIISKFGGRGAGFALAQGRFDAIKPAALMRSALPIPAHRERTKRAVVVKPCPLARLVAVSALPDLAHPAAIAIRQPAYPRRGRQAVHSPCVAPGRMLENATPATNRSLRRRKAPAVITGPIVIASIAFEIQRGQVHPQMARGVRHDRMRPRVGARVSKLGPRVNVCAAGIASVRLNKQRGDSGQGWIGHGYFFANRFSTAPTCNA